MADNLNLPPSISGDGRTFVSALRKILANITGVITETIEPIVNPGLNTNTPTAPTNFIVEFSKNGALWRWDYSDNINIDFFELREDANPGNELRLLYRTRTTQANVVPSVRSGTVYLYARWLNGRYSNPITIQYNKAIPAFPTNVTIEKVFQGFVISCDPIPDDCSGITFRINGEDFFSPNNSFTYNTTMGDFVVKVAYKDIFGNGVFSEEQSTTIIEVVPPNLVHVSGTTVFDDGIIVSRMIGDNEVVRTKIKDGEITTDKIGANQITGVHIVGNAVTGDHIEAGSEIRTPVLIGGTIKGARIQNTDNTAYIDSDGTVSGVNIIGSTVSGTTVNSSTINSTTLNSVTVNSPTINAGAVQLDNSGMKVTETNGAYTKFDANGITWYSPAQRPFSTIRRTIYGTVNSGERVYFSEAFDKNPIIMITPTILKTYDPNVPQPTQLICRPTPLSVSDPYMKTGFLAQIETRVDGSRIYAGGSNVTDQWYPPGNIGGVNSWQTTNIRNGIGSNQNRGRVYGARTTDANTTAIYANMAFKMIGGYNHYFSAFFAQGYYKPSGSPNWIAGGRWNAPFPGGDYKIGRAHV